MVGSILWMEFNPVVLEGKHPLRPAHIQVEAHDAEHVIDRDL
jgi:hypothetical protein